MINVTIDVIQRINYLYNVLKTESKIELEQALYFVQVDKEVKQLVHNINQITYDRYEPPTF